MGAHNASFSNLVARLGWHYRESTVMSVSLHHGLLCRVGTCLLRATSRRECVYHRVRRGPPDHRSGITLPVVPAVRFNYVE